MCVTVFILGGAGCMVLVGCLGRAGWIIIKGRIGWGCCVRIGAGAVSAVGC